MCTCTGYTAKQYLVHDQQQKLLQFLIGVNESYAQIRSQILTMNAMPSVGQVFSIIFQEESHRLLSTFEAPSTFFLYVLEKSNPQKGYLTM